MWCGVPADLLKCDRVRLSNPAVGGGGGGGLLTNHDVLFILRPLIIDDTSIPIDPGTSSLVLFTTRENII